MTLPSRTPFGGPVAVQDANGDGIPDLVFAASDQFASFTVYVAIGNGNGTFQTPVAMSGPTIFGATSIVLADLNGDKKTDIAVSSCCGATNTFFYLGNGNGTFGAPSSLAIAGSGAFMVGADLNGNGKTDLVELISTSGVVPLINISGEVPPPIVASVAAEKLERWRNAHGVAELARLELEDLYFGLMDRVVGFGIEYARNRQARQHLISRMNPPAALQASPRTADLGSSRPSSATRQ